MIHLVNIAPEFRGVEDFSRPPSGLLYIGNELKKHGFQVKVHHVVARRMAETTKALAADPDADWVGFSFFTGPPVARAAAMSKALKAARPDLRVCWGGVHPPSIPQDCVSLPYVDACVVGVGEETSVELAQAWSDGSDLPAMQGLVWKRAGGEVVTNPGRPIKKDLDRFAQDWSLVDPQRYVRLHHAGDRICCITTSRGCPYECGFCYVLDFHERRWRYHSPDHVLGQLRWLKARTNITHVVFDDDEFFPLGARGFEILERLRHEDIRCNWLETALDHVDDEFVRRLVATGVETVFVGWESGSDRTHATLRTGLTRDMNLEKFRIIAKHPELTVKVEGYMKVLYHGRRQRAVQGFLRRVGGRLAEARLRTRFFGVPLDLAAHGWFQRRALLRNVGANKISLAGMASPAAA